MDGDEMCGMFVTGLPLPVMTIILILTVFSQDYFVVGGNIADILDQPAFPVEVGSHHKRFRSLMLV